MASSSKGRLGRDDYKKRKELDEMRKAGTVPAETDEDGKMINPHIPNYIKEAPWYLDTSHPGLKHQKKSNEKPSLFPGSDIHKFQRRGISSHTAKKFRKGACENCGAMTHQKKDCVERPRKRGAILTNKNIRPDEIIDSVQLTFDGKRDRWAGYDPSSYKRVITHFERTDAARSKAKEEQLDKQQQQQQHAEQICENGDTKPVDIDSDDSDAEDTAEAVVVNTEEFKDSGALIQKRDGRNRTTVRNLRIREDRAKYLHNLNVDSAYYDPKSRSMRENPNPNVDPNDLNFAGDNFVRNSGETMAFTNVTLYAWDEAEAAGGDVTQAANPSQTEFAFREQKTKAEQQRKERKERLIATYGGTNYMKDEAALSAKVAQSEHYVEYARDGKVLKGLDASVATSKYEEDVFERGHKSVWGSFYQNQRWGYECCHQTSRNAFCTGDDGKIAAAQVAHEMKIRQSIASSRVCEAKRDGNTTTTTTTTTTATSSRPTRPVTYTEPSSVDIDRYQRNKHRDGDPML